MGYRLLCLLVTFLIFTGCMQRRFESDGKNRQANTDAVPEWFKSRFSLCVDEVKSDELFGGLQRPEITAVVLDKLTAWWEESHPSGNIAPEMLTPFLKFVAIGRDASKTTDTSKDPDAFLVTPWRNPLTRILT